MLGEFYENERRNSNEEDEEEEIEEEKDDDEENNIHRGELMDVINLQPSKLFHITSNPKLNIANQQKEIMNFEGFSDSLSELVTKTDEFKASMKPEEYPKIVMLGTGSAVSSKTRNTSCILVRINEEHSLVLDCGEGAVSQMTRFYGRSKIRDILSTIKVFFLLFINIFLS